MFDTGCKGALENQFGLLVSFSVGCRSYGRFSVRQRSSWRSHVLQIRSFERVLFLGDNPTDGEVTGLRGCGAAGSQRGRIKVSRRRVTSAWLAADTSISFANCSRGYILYTYIHERYTRRYGSSLKSICCSLDDLDSLSCCSGVSSLKFTRRVQVRARKACRFAASETNDDHVTASRHAFRDETRWLEVWLQPRTERYRRYESGSVRMTRSFFSGGEKHCRHQEAVYSRNGN